MGWRLLRIWAAIGLQSFGGGASTLLLIRREFVDKRGWIGAEEMAHLWNLCLFTPGINLIALTVLIGRKLGGTRGIIASLAGLLLPSASLTCLLAAGFEAVQHSAAVHAILRGVIPATAGIMALVMVSFAQPIMQRARREGVVSMAVNAALILAGAIALIHFKLSVVTVLIGVALLGVALLTPWRAPRSTLAPAPAPPPALTPVVTPAAARPSGAPSPEEPSA